MKTDKLTLFVYCNFLVLLSTPVCSQNKNKQNVHIADETLTDYSFLCGRYHYTKLKNYLKRRYQIRHWIPMFFGTPCRTQGLSKKNTQYNVKSVYCTVLVSQGKWLNSPYFIRRSAALRRELIVTPAVYPHLVSNYYFSYFSL